MHTLYKKLCPKVTPLVHYAQGKTDPKEPWCIARVYWCGQLVIRTKFRDWAWLAPHVGYKPTDPPPAWFDINQLTEININHIMFADEMHMDCEVGAAGRTRMQVRFKRDEHGNPDPVNGKYRDRLGKLVSFVFLLGAF